MVRRIASATVLLSAAAVCGAAEASPQGGAHGTSMLQLVLGAGAPEYLLIAFSFVAFAIAIQNFMVIKREAIVPDGLANDVHNCFTDGVTEDSIAQARSIVDGDPSSTGRILSAALNVSEYGHEAMLEAAEDANTSEVTKWMQKPGWMSLFANMATLLGLFGTVWGIIESFMAMAANPAGVDITKLSSTIGISLVTTANGMIIAIPMLAFGFAQRSKLAKFFRDSNDSVKEILIYFRKPVAVARV